MKCSYCRFELDNRQTVCPNCGAPIEYQTTLSHSVNMQKNTERSKAVYIWTAILFGGFGIHDFYAGYHLKGIIKVILFLTITSIKAVTTVEKLTIPFYLYILIRDVVENTIYHNI